jgi:hypothetical protein
MAKNKNTPPIGFGRKPTPGPDDQDAAHNDELAPTPAEKDLEPPLVEPIYVDDVVMYEFFKRYNLLPLTPVSRFEYQLVQICAALEKRVRELDHDL